jgi:aminotransferase in exopolysaccharide biosynthesis
MESFIPLSVPNLKGNELKYITEAVNDGWVSARGAFVSRLEQEFAVYAGVSEAAAVQSGTAALHLAMIECGVCAGDLVIAPALTFIAAVNPIRYVGAEPVFMDCDDSLCLNPDKLERYLREECEQRDGVTYDKNAGKPVRAIVVVHIFGNAADMERIMEIAECFNIPVIEDATEAIGTFYTSGRFEGAMAGTIGDFGAYSFNGNKIITTGGGGMFVARDSGSVKHARHLAAQAKTDELTFDHDEIGYNYRMTNVQAALGVAQLEQLEEFIRVKRENYLLYRELGVELIPFSKNVRPNYWFYSHPAEDRDGLIKYLGEQGIQARPIWKLIHTLSMYKSNRAYTIEKAFDYYGKIVNLPCSSNLVDEDVKRVVAAVKECGMLHCGFISERYSI